MIAALERQLRAGLELLAVLEHVGGVRSRAPRQASSMRRRL
jgi:hypothetical protein